MRGYLEDVLSDKHSTHQELSYWVAQKVRELMPHTTIQELLSEIFDESVHNQILESLEHRRELGNHVDLPAWIGMLFEAVLSRGQSNRQKFIVNKPLSRWFEELSYSSAYLCSLHQYNAWHRRHLCKNNDKFDLASKGLWFHGHHSQRG